MSSTRKSLQLTTQQRCALVDITGKVSDLLRQTGMEDGIAVVYSPHTTAGILINENCDPDVVRDTLLWMRLFQKTTQAFATMRATRTAILKLTW